MNAFSRSMATAWVTAALLCTPTWAQTKPPADGKATPVAGGKPGQTGAGSGARPQRPPAAVSVATVKLQDVDRTLSATGHAVPLQSVDVRAQVSALVEKVHVQEGQSVKAGQLLFSLDSRSAAAELAKAKATLARSQANLLELQRQLKRSQALQTSNFVSSSATETLAAQVQAQQAQVHADTASEQAQALRVSLYKITAPITGRVGSIDVFPGSLVGSNALLTITQMNPMGVAFALPQSAMPAIQRAGIGAGIKVQPPVGTSGSLEGRLKFIDSRIDPSTSMITLKAEVDNVGLALWPGTSMAVSLQAQTLKQVAVIPQAAVILRNDKTIVWLIGEDNKAKAQPVQTQEVMGERVAVRGLSEGDRVIVDGRQFVRPGTTVRVVGPAQE